MREFDRGRPLSQRHIDGLLSTGISPMALVKTYAGDYSLVSRDMVVMMGDTFEFGRFMSHGEAVQAFTFLCMDQDGEPADIAAWRPPELALWLGRVAMLGEEQALAPRLTGPLRVHRDVTAWFQAERQGVFVVDYRRAAHVFEGETLGVGTVEHAAELRTRLTIPAPPVVLVDKIERAA